MTDAVKTTEEIAQDYTAMGHSVTDMTAVNSAITAGNGYTA